MKRIFLLILGYYLIVQAALGGLAGIGQPETLIIAWPLSALFGYLGYIAVKKARSLKVEAK